MDEEQPLVSLVYASSKCRYVDGAELKEILKVAQKNNEKVGITGALLFNSVFFMQVLEGSREQVSHLYNKIIKDKRHKDVHLIAFNDVAKRKWKEWTMQLISITEKEEQVYYKYSNQKKFNPLLLDSNQAMSFLEEVLEVPEVDLK